MIIWRLGSTDALLRHVQRPRQTGADAMLGDYGILRLQLDALPWLS